jgi:hypothetical protein
MGVIAISPRSSPPLGASIHTQERSFYMKRQILVITMVSLCCSGALATYALESHFLQARTSLGTIEGTVVAANQSIHSIDVTIESNGLRYSFCIACQGTSPELIGIDNIYAFADNSAVGTRLRVTYTKIQRYKSQGIWMYSVDAKRVVKLDGGSQPPSTSSVTTNSWNQFWNAFRAAVRKRDKLALKRMMIVKFNSAAGVSYSNPDARAAALENLNWSNLDEVIRQGVGPLKNERGKTIRQAPPSLNGVGMVAFFELGKDGHWRWSDFYFYH